MAKLAAVKNIWHYDFPIGTLAIAADGTGITDICFRGAHVAGELVEQETPLLQAAAQQLQQYFAGSRTAFSLPLSVMGTDFQRAVWNALQAIPYGETCSYKQLAEKIGNSKACRAVGLANNRNPIMIVIPCHRVIGQDGSLVGYAGGIEVKRQLLAGEGRNFRRERS